MSVFPENWTLFVVDLEYTVPMEQVEPVLDDHMVFIKQGFETGRFVAAGRKVPRSGGVIVMTAPDLDDAQRYMAADPFQIAGVAAYRFTEFVPGTLHPALR